MLCVPSSLSGLLVLFESCFARPTFKTFRVLVDDQVSQTQLRCVTGMLVGSRLSAVWHRARGHGSSQVRAGPWTSWGWRWRA